MSNTTSVRETESETTTETPGNTPKSPASAPRPRNRSTTRGSRRTSAGRTATGTAERFRRTSADAPSDFGSGTSDTGRAIRRTAISDRRWARSTAWTRTRVAQDVRETAGVIYRRALDENLLPGRSIEGVATASLYAAARQAGTPPQSRRTRAVSRVGRRELTRTYRHVCRELRLEVEPTKPEQNLPRFTSALGLDEGVERRARSLLETARREGLHSGRSPSGWRPPRCTRRRC